MHPNGIDNIMRAQKEIKRTCSICFSEVGETCHLPIYITGSEGIELCTNCKMDLTEHLQQLRNVALRTKLQTFKSLKKDINTLDERRIK